MAIQLRVLLVEDSDDDALLLLIELRRGTWEVVHHRVDTAAGMTAALASGSWDIIISDYSMPQFSGIAALTLARQLAPDLPFILVSGTVGEEIAVVAMKAGAHDYIMKGQLTRLRPAVERELADASARRKSVQELHEAHEQLESRVYQRTAELAEANEKLRKEIGEREEAEQKLSTLNDQLIAATRVAELANEAKSSFLANMSHEIRTPMSAILGYSDLLQDEQLSSADRHDYLHTIRRNGEHLLTIINDVLDLSKIEAGKFLVERIECNPCQILGDVASLMRVRAIERLIRFEVHNRGPVPEAICTDPARLRQILINLVGNAIKFTDEGWVRLIVSLDISNDRPTRIRFDVLDTGIGMSPAQIAQLFHPFVQADGSTTRRFGGTGLGLSISKHLAKMLGGDIEVNSSPGRGSTFSLFIDPGPLQDVKFINDCHEALSELSIRHARNRDQIQVRGRVLLVDDGHDNRRLLSVYLRAAGMEVALAENGRIGCDKALAALADGQPYGVILMDMQMPEMDGYAAASHLRSKGYTGPIVALTAHAMAEDRQKCLYSGCTDYLSKPVRRAELVSLLTKYLASPHFEQIQAIRDPELETLPETSTDKQIIISTLKSEELGTLVRDFVEELPKQIAELAAALENRDLDRLATLVHNLKGTGGLYGFMPITDAASRVEKSISFQASLEIVGAGLNDLMAIMRRVRSPRIDGQTTTS